MKSRDDEIDYAEKGDPAECQQRDQLFQGQKFVAPVP